MNGRQAFLSAVVLAAGLPWLWAACAAPSDLRDANALAARFAELKPRRDRGLPLRPAREDWDGARRRVREDDAWRAWARSVTSRLDAWIAIRHDLPEWVAGYPHDLVDPVSGQPLRWSSAMPQPALGVPGSRQRKFHEAWVAYLRAYNLDRIQEASRVFRLTGDRRYADWAAEQLDFYAEHYADWPLQQFYGSRSRMLGQGLDEATATTRLIDAVRLLDGAVSPERRARWRDRLFMPIADNLRQAKVGVNNIALWHAVAVALIGMEFADRPLLQQALDGPLGVRAVIRTGLTADFIWYEGSLGYQEYVLRALAPLFVQAWLRETADLVQIEMLQAQDMLLAPLMLRFDDGMLPSPGDVTARLKAVDPDFLVEMYRAVPSLLGLAEAARRRNWDTLLDPADGAQSNPPSLPPVRSVDLGAIRMALLERQGWQLFFRYGQLTPYHSHEDGLNYELYFGDTPLSTDPGTVLYGSPLHEDYFRRSVAHNVAMIDGAGQAGWDPGVLERFDPDGGVVIATQPRFRPDTSVRREVRLEDGDLIDSLSSRIAGASPASRRLGFLFHTDCTVALDSVPSDGAAPAPPPEGRGFAFWDQITVRNVQGEGSAKLQCGLRRFVARWRWSAPGRLYVARAPTTPLPKKRTVVYFETMGTAAWVEMRLHPLDKADGADEAAVGPVR